MLVICAFEVVKFRLLPRLTFTFSAPTTTLGNLWWPEVCFKAVLTKKSQGTTTLSTVLIQMYLVFVLVESEESFPYLIQLCSTPLQQQQQKSPKPKPAKETKTSQISIFKTHFIYLLFLLSPNLHFSNRHIRVAATSIKISVKNQCSD